MDRRTFGFIAAAVATTFAFAGNAEAASPTLLSVAHENRHPVATFFMPGADFATITFATAPDRSTDGSFLYENVKDSDSLTADEIQGGHWTYESQLDPGLYYVLLNASDFDCVGTNDPNCVEGYSEMRSLVIPKPPQRFRGKVTRYYTLSIVDLALTVTPAGDDVPYRVCWRQASKRRKCVRGTVDGYSWNSSASDSLTVRKRGMARVTRFSWYVGGRRVATKRVRVTRRKGASAARGPARAASPRLIPYPRLSRLLGDGP